MPRFASKSPIQASAFPPKLCPGSLIAFSVSIHRVPRFGRYRLGPGDRAEHPGASRGQHGDHQSARRWNSRQAAHAGPRNAITKLEYSRDAGVCCRVVASISAGGRVYGSLKEIRNGHTNWNLRTESGAYSVCRFYRKWMILMVGERGFELEPFCGRLSPQAKS